LKQDVIDADEKSQGKAGQAFYQGLVCRTSFLCLIDIDYAFQDLLEDLIVRMGYFPPGAWEFSSPSFVG